MRENMGIYHGKTEDGEWVEGGYLHQTDWYGDRVDRHFIIDGTTTQDYDIGYPHEVLPETVGEWTGLTDKNGKRIFEGDIAQVWRSTGLEGQLRGKYYKPMPVEYSDLWCQFVLVDEYNKQQFGIWQNFSAVEIVGNLADNPELVKEW